MAKTPVDMRISDFRVRTLDSAAVKPGVVTTTSVAPGTPATPEDPEAVPDTEQGKGALTAAVLAVLALVLVAAGVWVQARKLDVL